MRSSGFYWVKILRPMVDGSWTVGEFDSNHNSWTIIGFDDTFIDSELKEIGEQIVRANKSQYIIRNSIGCAVTHIMAKDSGEALAVYSAMVGLPIIDIGWSAELDTKGQ